MRTCPIHQQRERPLPPVPTTIDLHTVPAHMLTWQRCIDSPRAPTTWIDQGTRRRRCQRQAQARRAAQVASNAMGNPPRTATSGPPAVPESATQEIRELPDRQQQEITELRGRVQALENMVTSRLTGQLPICWRDSTFAQKEWKRLKEWLGTAEIFLLHLVGDAQGARFAYQNPRLCSINELKISFYVESIKIIMRRSRSLVLE